MLSAFYYATLSRQISIAMGVPALHPPRYNKLHPDANPGPRSNALFAKEHHTSALKQNECVCTQFVAKDNCGWRYWSDMTSQCSGPTEAEPARRSFVNDATAARVKKGDCGWARCSNTSAGSRTHAPAAEPRHKAAGSTEAPIQEAAATTQKTGSASATDTVRALDPAMRTTTAGSDKTAGVGSRGPPAPTDAPAEEATPVPWVRTKESCSHVGKPFNATVARVSARLPNPWVPFDMALYKCAKMYHDCDGLSEIIRLYGNWEQQHFKLVKSALTRSPRPVFVNVGLNIGYWAMLALQLNATVHGFEPFRTNAAMSQYSSCLNYGRVESSSFSIWNLGLGAKRDSCALYSDKRNFGDGHVRCKSSGVQESHERDVSEGLSVKRNNIEIYRFDDVFESETVVDLMMVDIEGFEYQFLLGAEAFFKSHRARAVFLECNRAMLLGQGGSPELVLSFFENSGYTLLNKGDVTCKEETYLTFVYRKGGAAAPGDAELFDAAQGAARPFLY